MVTLRVLAQVGQSPLQGSRKLGLYWFQHPGQKPNRMFGRKEPGGTAGWVAVENRDSESPLLVN